METAAPVGAGNGGNQIGKPSYGSDNPFTTDGKFAASNAAETIRNDPHNLARRIAGQCGTIAKLHEVTAKLFKHYRGTPAEDAFIASFYEAADERRAELRGLAQGGASHKTARQQRRYPDPLPSLTKTKSEKLEAARKRRSLADFLVRQMPEAFGDRLPRCASARSVLAVICNLCARSRNRCDAAINTIAEMAGVSRSSVNQALRLLEALNLIVIDSGRLRGTVSVIRVLATPLQKLVAYCRSRLSGWKRHKASDANSQLSFFEGGVQKSDQKEDSINTKKDKRQETRERDGSAGISPKVRWLILPAAATI